MWGTGRKAKCVGMEFTGNVALVLLSLQESRADALAHCLASLCMSPSCYISDLWL